MNERKDNSVRIRMTDTEKEIIERRAREAGFKSVSKYIRSMALNGYVMKLKLDEIFELNRLMAITANNVNQYAHKANSTNATHLREVLAMQKEFERLQKLFTQILETLGVKT